MTEATWKTPQVPEMFNLCPAWHKCACIGILLKGYESLPIRFWSARFTKNCNVLGYWVGLLHTCSLPLLRVCRLIELNSSAIGHRHILRPMIAIGVPPETDTYFLSSHMSSYMHLAEYFFYRFSSVHKFVNGDWILWYISRNTSYLRRIVNLTDYFLFEGIYNISQTSLRYFYCYCSNLIIFRTCISLGCVALVNCKQSATVLTQSSWRITLYLALKSPKFYLFILLFPL